MVLICKFECKICGIKESVAVPPRPNAEHSSLIPWINNVLLTTVQQYHLIVSPKCRARHVDMMIPVTSSGIGLEGAPLTEEEKKEIGEMIKRVNKKHESDN